MRKPRPLSRDTGSLRDTRLFIVACDDTYAPKQYFGFFKNSRVQVHVVPTEDTRCDALHVLRRLQEFEHEAEDELWLLLDTDHYAQGTHLQNFTAALREARQQGIHVALSKPSFEMWLLLHRVEGGAIGPSWNANRVAAALRANLGHYNKTNLQPEDYRSHSIGRLQKGQMAG